MSSAVAPINNTPASQSTSAPTGPTKSSSQPTPDGDTVQLSSTAQAVLTPAQTLLEEADTHSQLVKAAADGDPLARSVLVSEAAFVGIPKGA